MVGVPRVRLHGPAPGDAVPRLIFLLPLVLLVACPSADDDGDGWTVNEGDCDDADSEVHPGHSEECNSIDDDCDGSVDENLDQFSWFPDLDGDGFGDGESSPVSACGGTDAEATNGTA